MIRINLLPQKKRVQQAEGSQLWAVAVLVLLAAEIVALFVFHGMEMEKLDAQKRENAQVQAQIDQAKAAVKDQGKVKEELARLRAREDAITKLQTARTGPTAVLLELARLMTPGRGPSVDPERLNQLRRENPLAMYNPGWDGRRLWLSKFVENQRRVRVEGLARDGEDISELARRMSLSSYFYDVKLLPGKKTKGEGGVELVSFQLEAKVRY